MPQPSSSLPQSWRQKPGISPSSVLQRVYIAGGVAVHALRAIKEPTFIQRFRRKGRFVELMARIPIQVVTGLAGAAACGLENLPMEAQIA